MAQTQVAAVCTAKDVVELLEVPLSELKEDEAELRISHCGICGSDMHKIHMGPREATCVLGHEFSAVVTRLGSKAKEVNPHLKSGSRVVAEAKIHCDTCDFCLAGYTNQCDKWEFYGLGFPGRGGGMASSCNVQARYLHILPESLTDEIGALVEPLATAWHAVKQAGNVRDKNVLILGAGPIGLMVLLVLKLSKCRSIVVSEPSKRRRELAKTFGADYTYNPLECDLAQECKQVAGSQGVQVVFDCAGIPSAFNSALNIMQKRSIFVTIAMWSPDRPATFNPSLLMAKEITLTGAMAYTPQDFREVIAALASGTLNTAGLITDILSLDDVVKGGYESIKQNPDDHVKVLVHM